MIQFIVHFLTLSACRKLSPLDHRGGVFAKIQHVVKWINKETKFCNEATCYGLGEHCVNADEFKDAGLLKGKNERYVRYT